MAATGAGFIYDEASGLYFHASSGFYHDASAGWYYDTNDGVYYKFEEGTYVPIMVGGANANVNEVSDSEMSQKYLETESAVLYLEEQNLESKESGSSTSGVHCVGTAFAEKSLEGRGESEEILKGPLSAPQLDLASLEIGFPLWYYDSLRSAYWYFDKESNAYHRYDEERNNLPKEAAVDPQLSQELSKTGSTTLESGEHAVLSEESLPLISAVQCPESPLASRHSLGCDASQGDTVEEGVSIPQVDTASPEVAFPLWYFDSLRSEYWYYDNESRAYYKYHEEDSKVGTPERRHLARNDILQQDQSNMKEAVTCDNGESVREVEGLPVQATSQSGEDMDNFNPMSGWVEEALIELYLKGYPGEGDEKDNGPWITSADIFSEGSPKSPSHKELRHGETPASKGNSWATDCKVSKSGVCSIIHGLASGDDSDNDGSEELEEGEWVPDEPLRIVDETLYLEEPQAFTHFKEKVERETSEFSSAEPNGDYRSHHDDLEEGEWDNREIELDEGDTLIHPQGQVSMEESEDVKVDNQQRKEEEQWQAQFGQVARGKSRTYEIPGAVDLWDWMTIETEPTALKPGKVVKKLVGRIASSVTKLVSASSGLIRTSAIHAAERDFVKVSSGKLYRLRRPSLKHMATLETYDSSNPTKDWGFPALGLSCLDTSEDSSLCETGSRDQIGSRTDCLVSKPFVPNTGHWQFQNLASANSKKGRRVPAALLACKYLSAEEIQMHEQRKQKYRDRAAERRTLHGGFGTGPGQKGLTPREQEKLDADRAAEMEGALETAAAAPPLGRENVGKRMLESMGWKEGQSIGGGGGLVTPLQARGNDRRAGLGWS